MSDRPQEPPFLRNFQKLVFEGRRTVPLSTELDEHWTIPNPTPSSCGGGEFRRSTFLPWILTVD